MAITIGGAAALEAITGQMAGMSGVQAYNRFITDQFETDDGPTIGYANYTSNTPAISGDTSGSISTGTPSVNPVDAWHDYVENENPSVSETTGGVVSGSRVTTLAYSIMEEHPGTAQAVAKAVIPVAVPLDAAITAIGQAVGVSIDVVNLDIETKQALADSYTATGGVIYDKAKGLVTAWKDELGRILFPKKAFDAVYETIASLDIGGSQSATYSKYPGITIYPSNAVTLIANNQAGVITTDGDFLVRNSSSFVYAFSRTSGKTIRTQSPGSGWSDQTTQLTRTINVPGVGTVYYNNSPAVVYDNMSPSISRSDSASENVIADIYYNGVIEEGGYPDGTSESQADKYSPSTIPIAGNLATSYNPDTGALGTEPLVPIHLADDPYNTTGDTTNPTDPTSEDNPGVVNPPVPLPIPDTRPSNPDVPLTNSSVINSTRIKELVEELANTLDPQPGQSSGIIPIPPLPGIEDPETGHTTFPSIIPQSGPGFIHVYNPTPSEFVAFGTWLWVTYADATIDKILNNPFDGVIGAHELYATPNRGGSDNIRSAFLTCPTTAALVPNRYSEIDCGTVVVPEFYGNYLDYSPYSQAYIYLPFIGINEVSIDDIVGHAVNIRYRVDSYSGSCIAMIFVAKDGYQSLCYQFAGSCSVEVPMAGGSQAAIKAGMMQAEAYARSSMVSAGGHLLGGIGSALMGSLGGAISGISGIAGDYANAQAGVEAARVANKSSVQHSGQFGASHGAMGQKIPFIIIRNPIQVKVVNYNDDYGYPAHKRVIIGGCTGYLRVREVNVISAHATDDEKAAIEALLKNGIYVS